MTSGWEKDFHAGRVYISARHDDPWNYGQIIAISLVLPSVEEAMFPARQVPLSHPKERKNSMDKLVLAIIFFLLLGTILSEN